MLSLAKAVKDYYLQKLGEISPREDYYLRGGTASGRWVGSGAVELDLHGTVSAEGLVRLFDGEASGYGGSAGSPATEGWSGGLGCHLLGGQVGVSSVGVGG